MTKSDIQKIEKRIGYSFSDKSLLIQAFTRTSYCNEHNRRGEVYSSNEVLEFFGDSVLSTAIVSILLSERTERYNRGIISRLDEGDFSVIRSKLSDKRNLSVSMTKLGLSEYLLMGEGDTKLGIASEPSVLEDLFESIIGAIYIDSGMNMETVIRSVNLMLDLESYKTMSQKSSPSAKNALQELCASRSYRLPSPVYKTLKEEGPDHKKSYERACYVGERLVGIGHGKNCKIADAEAAEAALKLLRSEAGGKVSIPKLEELMPKLQELTARAKLPSPEFHDLGETEESTVTNPAFRIECKALGKTAVGIGRSKTEARAAAIAEILKDAKPETIAKNSKPNAKKATQTVAKQPKAKADKPKAKTVEKAKETDNRKKSARGSKGGAKLKK